MEQDKLSEGQYTSRDSFAADVRLIFENALEYNPEGVSDDSDEVRRCAELLASSFEKELTSEQARREDDDKQNVSEQKEKAKSNTKVQM